MRFDDVTDDFLVRGFFTAYRIERMSDFCILHLADTLILRSSLKAFFSVALENHILEHNKESLLNFIAKYPTKTDCLSRGDILPSNSVEVANLIALAKTNNVSEITLRNFSQHSAASAGGKSLQTQAVACLRCDYDLLAAMVTELYEPFIN